MIAALSAAPLVRCGLPWKFCWFCSSERRKRKGEEDGNEFLTDLRKEKSKQNGRNTSQTDQQEKRIHEEKRELCSISLTMCSFLTTGKLST